MALIVHGDRPARSGPVDFDAVRHWYRRAARDLPWRAAGVDPWQILVSEIMLQQTPVARVLPVWTAWVRRWPTAAATAAASPAELLRAWGKLGYPRRATRLHACATLITERHGGVVPAEVAALEQLPGVGAYTARAVACFGYGVPVPVVDTNVRRVIARAVHGRAAAGSPAPVRDHADAAALVPPDAGDADAAEFAAALMELGATVCTARAPDCAACPVRHCRWRAAGHPADDGPRRPAQRYAGTDRQVRGRLLDVLRADPHPVTRDRLDLAWPDDPIQRDRALASLLADGLVCARADGRYALPGG